MRGRQSACCFTGHRPGKLPWRYNEEDLRCVLLKARIADAVEAAYQEGFRHFLCGMALGCDLYFCECVLRLRQTHPDVTVEAAVPCPSQADAWPPDQRRRYERLVAACDFETLVSACYTPACMQRRNPVHGGVRHAPGAGDRGPAHCAGARPIGRGAWMRRRPVPRLFSCNMGRSRCAGSPVVVCWRGRQSEIAELPCLVAGMQPGGLIS